MTVETPSLFAQAIQEHLELKRRNAGLDEQMPIGRYANADPFENHPLFKSEEQARIEETKDGTNGNGSLGAETAEVEAHVLLAEPATREDVEDSLWGRSRDFDWGD